MGVLDDAIREHLDLKRARGGDPAEIERMEREALGPVRREPTIGSTRFEGVDEHSSVTYESDHGEEHLTELEELQELGYHDSTAPHLHPHHQHLDPHDEAQLEHEHTDAFVEEPEQPRRRFLRRNRPAPRAEAEVADSGFHDPESAFGDHDPLGYDPLEAHEPLAHEQPEQHELFEHDAALEDHEPLTTEEATAGEEAEPPPLQFEKPPKRPRFTTEPPATQPAVGEEPVAELQETTEFDVETHIAETRHLPDEEVSTEPSRARRPAETPEPQDAGAPADVATPTDAGVSADAPTEVHTVGPVEEEEDVLEETPDFLQDTPEHDRLWFEQRPPKDFDFDG